MCDTFQRHKLLILLNFGQYLLIQVRGFPVHEKVILVYFLQMSLFLGNLSSHTRRDELEHAFQRFGRCNIRVKDGYGFVVYDFPPNAEKALRTLRGKDICGEPITLTWSNKQPRLFHRFSRGAKPYKVPRGRISARRAVHASPKLGTNDRLGYRMGNTQPHSAGRRLDSVDILDEDASDHYGGEIHTNIKDDLPDEGKIVESNMLDDERWGEQAADLSNENGIGNELEFDRYEPSHSYDRRDEDDNHQVIHSDGSPILRDPQEDTEREQIGVATVDRLDSVKRQGTCYLCGKSGHKMRNCPQKDVFRRNKFSRFDSRQDDDINYRSRGKKELEEIGFGSRKLLRKSNISTRPDRNDKNPYGSGKHRKLKRIASSPTNNRSQSSQRTGYGMKKRSRREDGSPKSYHTKKARGSVSSHIHSEYSASRSRSHSQSSKSDPGSSLRARSRSISSRKIKSSSNSRSSSASLTSRSGKNKFRSKSSSPTSLPLSVSLSRPLDHAMSPESKKILVEDGQHATVDAVPNSSKPGNVPVTVNTENALSSIKHEDDVKEYHPWQRDVHGNHTTPIAKIEAKYSYKVPLENCTSTTGSSSPESLKEMRESRDSVALVTELRSETNNQSDIEVAISSHCCSSTSISPQEMYTVLKHYGLEQADEPESHLPVETHFGSARFWPWEIVYYRRLKKGSISTENYARRIAQNEEFGIIDKYIRSSSGWGEMRHDES